MYIKERLTMIENKRYNIYQIHIDDQRIQVYIWNIDMSLYLTQDSSQSKIRGWDNLYKLYTLYELYILRTMYLYTCQNLF